MSKFRALTAAAALSLGLANGAAAQDADTVVATVNGTEITIGHMIAYRASLGEQVAQMPPEELYDAILDQMISMTALSADRELAPGDVYIVENEERSLKARTAVEDLSGGEVTEEEISTAYDEMFGDFEGGPEFNASHILVETEEEAQTIIEELEGGADFADLAKTKSTGPSGPSGGELGWFGPGQMVPAFDQAVQDMEVGAIEGPVQTNFGWHVIKLNDQRTTEAPSQEEVRDRLEAVVQNQRITQAIEETREAAEVEEMDVDIDPAILNDMSLIGQ